MIEPLSDITRSIFFNQMKYHLPISKRASDVSIQNWINNALSRYNKVYVDNNKGIYDVTEVIDFYNVNSSIVNIRALNTASETRWCLIQPKSFYCAKLTSCRLKQINPDDEIASGIAYVQDVPISIISGQSVNSTEPSANSGVAGLIGGRQILTALTLDNTGIPFSNIIQIEAVYTYYRNVINIDWLSETDPVVDILKKDVELIANYVVEEAYLPNKSPNNVAEAIRDREYQLIYGG